ncbi:MAG TPA: cyanophycin synthetase [Vicinamibacteria bacterium]|nr:cyanophycin synthetase [Vicinamibacteria bacterium]
MPGAVAGTRWPGRLERVPGEPPLLLDGAHNPAGARALAAYLEHGPPFVLLFGAMADKDVRGLARELFPPAADIVLTRPRVSRAASPEEIARRSPPLGAHAQREASVARALRLARRLALAHGPGTTVVVAGSLYLVGAVKALLLRGVGRQPRGGGSAPARTHRSANAPMLSRVSGPASGASQSRGGIRWSAAKRSASRYSGVSCAIPSRKTTS